MSDVTVGKVITSLRPGRDAIHVAVAPVVASERLYPGQRIAFTIEGNPHVGAAVKQDNDCVGIVDPYLEHSVGEGDKFWMFLLPGSTNSLRHSWSHPSFREEVEEADYYDPGNECKGCD